MPIPYDREQLRQLREEGARIIAPRKDQILSMRRLRKQFGPGVQMEFVRRSTLDGDEYQPQIVIKATEGSL